MFYILHYYITHNMTNEMHFALFGDSSVEFLLWPSLRIWEKMSIFWVFIGIIWIKAEKGIAFRSIMTIYKA